MRLFLTHFYFSPKKNLEKLIINVMTNLNIANRLVYNYFSLVYHCPPWAFYFFFMVPRKHSISSLLTKHTDCLHFGLCMTPEPCRALSGSISLLFFFLVSLRSGVLLCLILCRHGLMDVYMPIAATPYMVGDCYRDTKCVSFVKSCDDLQQSVNSLNDIDHKLAKFLQ